MIHLVPQKVQKFNPDKALVVQINTFINVWPFQTFVSTSSFFPPFSLYSISSAFIAFKIPFSSPKLNPGPCFSSLPACFTLFPPSRLCSFLLLPSPVTCGIQFFLSCRTPTMERVSQRTSSPKHSGIELSPPQSVSFGLRMRLWKEKCHWHPCIWLLFVWLGFFWWVFFY